MQANLIGLSLEIEIDAPIHARMRAALAGLDEGTFTVSSQVQPPLYVLRIDPELLIRTCTGPRPLDGVGTTYRLRTAPNN